MKYRIYSTSEKAWKGMLKSIDAARESVYLEMYILDDDATGAPFFSALEAAAERGVKVVAILDIVGSFKIFGNAISSLRNKGAEVIFCSSFFKRLHRKVLITDEKTAFIGGVNVGKRFARWKDLQIEISGQAVKTALRSFIRAYKNCGGKNFLAARYSKENPWKRARLWFVDHGIGKRSHLLREHYEGALGGAHKSIVLVTPYLLPPRWLIASLHQALIRGVRVEILLPQSSDHRTANSVNRSYASFFTGLGATCYFMRGMNHAKAMLIDDREGTIGSQNLDLLSFNWNIEAGVFFAEPDMVRDLAGIIKGWKSEAEIFDKEKNGPNTFRWWYDIPAAFFLRLLGFVPLW